MVPLDTNIIHYKQLLVTGTTRQSLRHFQKTLDLISSGVIEVENLITSTHSIAEAKAAITQAMATRGLKTRIAFGLTAFSPCVCFLESISARREPRPSCTAKTVRAWPSRSFAHSPDTPHPVRWKRILRISWRR